MAKLIYSAITSLDVTGMKPGDHAGPVAARRTVDRDEPALLVEVVLDSYPARPMERALLAWDVVRSTLLGRDDAFAAQHGEVLGNRWLL